MRWQDIQNGMEVMTTTLYDTSDWRIIKDDYFEKRKKVRESGVVGTVVNFIPGQGGELWLIRHKDTNNLSVYRFDEFVPAKPNRLNERARQ